MILTNLKTTVILTSSCKGFQIYYNFFYLFGHFSALSLKYGYVPWWISLFPAATKIGKIIQMIIDVDNLIKKLVGPDWCDGNKVTKSLHYISFVLIS